MNKTPDNPPEAQPPPPPDGQLLIYHDGGARLQVRLDGQTVWLTQAAMAELYQTTPQNITQNIKSIYEDGELASEATCKDYLQVRDEAGRQVRRTLKHYSLDMIIAVGYRVRSARGTAFRQWATARLWKRGTTSRTTRTASSDCPYGLAKGSMAEFLHLE